MLDDVTQFGKDQGLAGQLAGLQTARHTENSCFAHNPGHSARHESGRVDIFVAELGKLGGKGCEFLVQKGFDSFDGHIFFSNAGAAGHQHRMRAVCLHAAP